MRVSLYLRNMPRFFTALVSLVVERYKRRQKTIDLSFRVFPVVKAKIYTCNLPWVGDGPSPSIRVHYYTKHEWSVVNHHTLYGTVFQISNIWNAMLHLLSFRD